MSRDNVLIHAVKELGKFIALQLSLAVIVFGKGQKIAVGILFAKGTQRVFHKLCRILRRKGAVGL